MKKHQALEIIKEAGNTYLLNFLIHGKSNKQIKELVKEELTKRGVLI